MTLLGEAQVSEEAQFSEESDQHLACYEISALFHKTLQQGACRAGGVKGPPPVPPTPTFVVLICFVN